MDFATILAQINNKRQQIGLGVLIFAILVLGIFIGEQRSRRSFQRKTPEALHEEPNSVSILPTPTLIPTVTPVKTSTPQSPDKEAAQTAVVTSTPLHPTNTPAPQPTNTLSPSPTTLPTPTPTSSFWPSEPERHESYPIIIKVSDNLGNFTTGSDGNGIPFFVTWPESNPTVRVGQTVLITVEAEDPNGDPLEYQFKNNQNKVVQDWSSNNTFSWLIKQETGGNPFIVPAIRDNDSTLRFGSFDDSTVLYYQLE